MSGCDWAAGGVGGLVEAVRKGHPRHVQLLLEAGVLVDGQDHSGETAMVAAVLTPQEDRLREKLMRLLLQAGANPNAGDTRGTTPLMHAAIKNVVPAAVFLLQQEKVDLSLQDGDGNSALMYAAAFGHSEIVLLILAAFKQLHHIAVQGQRNSQGLTAHQLAQTNGHEDIAALLQVESEVFGGPAGPTCFVPTNPLDLDRPPTPTETPSLRTSKRLKNARRSNTLPPDLSDPTAPLQPVCVESHSFSGKIFSSIHRRRRERNNSLSKDVPSDVPTFKSGENSTSGSKPITPEGSNRSGVRSQKADTSSEEIRNLNGDTDYTEVVRSADKELKGNPVDKPSGSSRCWLKKQQSKESAGKASAAGESSGKDSVDHTCEVISLDPQVKDVPEKRATQNQSKTQRTQLVTDPDAAEKQVLEELMRDITLNGSPGSGNEADTESLMECEGSPRRSSVDKMSGSNNRKMSMTNTPPMVAALTSPNEFMPKIELSSSSRSLNRSIQHLVQEDAENRPSHRPPTPARPSLPTLLPGRVVDSSLNNSMASTKSDGRHAPPSRRITFSSLPRSSSEPRSLTSSPRPHQTSGNDYEDDSDENSSDFLDSSTRSEGWDHLRGSRGRGPAFTGGSEGHVVSLPPINQSQYSESGWRGRDGSRNKSGMPSHGENVLNVAKKTLEQLETVLAPTESHSLSRSLSRTRAPHQIHLET